jgi:hypothetical protein
LATGDWSTDSLSILEGSYYELLNPKCTRKIVSGTDPKLLAKPGGPLHVFLIEHGSGYVLDLRGYVSEQFFPVAECRY